MGTALVNEIHVQSLPLVQGYPYWDWLYLYFVAFFPVLDIGSGVAGGPRTLGPRQVIAHK